MEDYRLMDRTQLMMHDDIRPEFQRELPTSYDGLIQTDPLMKDETSYADLWTAKVWRNGGLSDFGRKISPSIRGKTFLDLGCGAGRAAFASKDLGARKYIGVDSDYYEAGKFDIREFGTEDTKPPFYQFFVEGDMLSFLARRSVSDGTIFFSSGIARFKDGVEEYLDALHQEMARLARPGDVAISVGGYQNAIEPEEAGFRLMWKPGFLEGDKHYVFE